MYGIAGATSELGNRVVEQLVARTTPSNVVCLVRPTSDVRFLQQLGVHLVTGDVTDPESLRQLLGLGVSAFLDMTHPKYYDRSLSVVQDSGVRRVFFVTTTGVFSQHNDCADIYLENEARIRSSGLDYTIIRPSLIYGTDRDRNMTKLLRFLSTWPLFPIFGDGQRLMQPVYVQDLADGIVAAVERDELSRFKEYNLCGPRPLTYKRLLQTACEALGRKVALVHVPHQLALAGARVGQLIPGFPITYEQVMRLMEDKAFDISLAAELDYRPRDFAAGIAAEVQLLRAKGIIR